MEGAATKGAPYLYNKLILKKKIVLIQQSMALWMSNVEEF